jgi:hypothetical protein
MRMLRSVAAIVAGFGFMASTVMIGSIVGTALFVPGGMQAAAGGALPAAVPPMYLATNLATSAAGAVLGGWLAARIAAFAPYGHAAVLAAIVAVLSAGSVASGPAGPQPGWYPAVIGVIGVAGILLGGKLRAAAAAAGAHVVA